MVNGTDRRYLKWVCLAERETLVSRGIYGIQLWWEMLTFHVTYFLDPSFREVMNYIHKHRRRLEALKRGGRR